ncbi:hypothetical protein [Streptomyces pini]|uniref:Uncharacterized protein n=1 Tax=Streptomyces pini TaxID=1520580 RepID=A0A1I4BZ55_9ACTN|nr:hypothetical protein [Streptomyces pini]SFK74084.1 hypothetical protein SAMN05192584_108196 [Streptomyces pini]
MAEQPADRQAATIARARATLAASQQLDMGDERAVARMLGRLEVAIASLLDVLDGEDQ